MIPDESFIQKIRYRIQETLSEAANAPVSQFFLGPRIIRNSEASNTIQKRLREVLDRREVRIKRKNLLPYETYADAVKVIDDVNKTGALMPKAIWGCTRVYLPENVPVAIKETKPKVANLRFNELKEAREVVDLNHFKSLVVPQARVHGEILIEKRLPLVVYSQKHSIGLYIENVDKFNEAAVELAQFLCDTSLEDIQGNTLSYEVFFSEVPIARYDNIAIYLENGKGRVGLIDLKNIDQFPSFPLEACKTAIRFFPYHFETIFSTVMKVDPEIEKHRKELETERDKVLAYFKAIYIDHFECLIRNGISIVRPERLIPLTAERRTQIVEKASSIITQMALPDDVKNIAIKACYDCLDYLMDILEAQLADKVRFKKSIDTNYDLLEARSLLISLNDFIPLVVGGFIQKFPDTLSQYVRRQIAFKLYDAFLTNLNRKEIPYCEQDYRNHIILFL